MNILIKTASCVSILLLGACGLFSTKKDSAPKQTLVTIKGSSVLPSVLAPLNLYKNSKFAPGLSFAWVSCPSTGNQSKASSTYIVVESKNNCAGSQYIYFEASPTMDLSDYANGTLSFTVEANNTQQGLRIFIQDDTKASDPINLSSFGYDSSKASVLQTITVPIISLIGSTAIDLKKVKRPLQMNITCPNSDCLTKINDIQLKVKQSATALAMDGFKQYLVEKLTQKQDLPLASYKPKYCDPGPCRAASNAPIKFVQPSQSGWTATGVQVGSTGTNGDYSFTGFYKDLIDAATNAGLPIYLALTDPNSGLTFIALIPTDKLVEDSNGEITLDLNIDLSTTALAELDCPGGIVQDGACSLRPKASTYLDLMYPDIDAFWQNHSPDSDDPLVIFQELASDEKFAKDFNEEAASRNAKAIDLTKLIKKIQDNPLPTINVIRSSSTSSSNSSDSSTSAVPSGVVPGTYQVVIKTCVQGQCTNSSPTSSTINDPSKEVPALVKSLQTGCSASTSQADTSCNVTYTDFDGSSFTASWTVTSCVEGNCANAVSTMTFTKQ